VPSDGFRAHKVRVGFVGVIDLDRTSLDDLEFVEALRLGAPVRAIVTGAVSGKGFTLTNRPHEDEVGYYCSVRIDGVEIGEPAECRGRQADRSGRVRYGTGGFVKRQLRTQLRTRLT
jgi:hypothetical protein